MATRVLLMPSVLLVNDALDEREMYARTLRAVGYRAIHADNSTAAFEIATTYPPDVVVTDVRIAGSIGGLELTRRLRNNVRTAAVRIIVLTLVSRPQDAVVALKAGANAFLEKPVLGSVLTAEIARLLGLCQSHTCPLCDGPITYRGRWPILTSDHERSTNGRERIRYAAGWFCTNMACSYQYVLHDDQR